MKISVIAATLFLALRSYASVSPVVAPDGGIMDGGIWHYNRGPVDLAKDIRRCENADNCEVYDTGGGRAIRFKATMRPGTEWYRKKFGSTSTVRLGAMNNGTESKASSSPIIAPVRSTPALRRRETISTYMHMANFRINYGNTEPYKPLHNVLYDSCQRNGCQDRDYAQWTKIVGRTNKDGGYVGTEPVDNVLYIRAEGYYNGYDQRDIFVESIKAMSKEGRTHRDASYLLQQYNPGGQGSWSTVNRGSQLEFEQSDWFEISKWSEREGGYLMGTMKAKIVLAERKDGGCANVLKVGAAVVNAVNGIAGGFFGILELFC